MLNADPTVFPYSNSKMGGKIDCEDVKSPRERRLQKKISGVALQSTNAVAEPAYFWGSELAKNRRVTKPRIEKSKTALTVKRE